jgi:hypothetical protein
MNIGATFKNNKQIKENDNILFNYSENSVLYKYKLYKNLYEMDVVYTIQQDLTSEKDDYLK